MKTTCTTNKSESLNFDDILKAIEKLGDLPPKPEPIEVGGDAAWKYLKSLCEVNETVSIGSLYGVEVRKNKLLPENAMKIGNKIIMLKAHSKE